MYEFYLSDSFVRIGSNADDNWMLIETLKRTDIWVHLKDVPSCHAVVRLPKKHRDDTTSRMNTLNHVARMICIQSAKRIPPGAKTVSLIYTRGKYVNKGRVVGEAVLSVTPAEFSVDNPNHI